MKKSISRKNIRTSYLINTPIGFLESILILILLKIIIADDYGLIILVDTYGIAIIAQYISLVFAIGIGTKIAYQKFIKKEKKLSVAFTYSLSVNLIIWAIFIIVTIIDNIHYNIPFILLPVVLIIIISVLIMTFINGIIVFNIFKKNIEENE